MRAGFALLLALLVGWVTSPAVAAAVPAASGDRPRLGACGSGEFCLWEDQDFAGQRLVHELDGTPLGSCVTLPGGFTADAYANRTGRPVTTYQSAECQETAEFHTHPSGSWTPESAYQVRAFKLWER